MPWKQFFALFNNVSYCNWFSSHVQFVQIYYVNSTKIIISNEYLLSLLILVHNNLYLQFSTYTFLCENEIHDLELNSNLKSEIN